jgi:outer membrane protein assembly factor BamB
MSTTSTYKECPQCGVRSPGSQLFCVDCGASLAAIAPVTGLVRVEATQFSLPDYLRSDPYRKAHLRGFFADETGTGSGLVWTGAIVAAAAVIFTPMDGLGVTVLGLGVLFVVGGFWRMRTDQEALSRAGLAIMGLAVLALATMLFQVLGPQRQALTTAAPPPIAQSGHPAVDMAASPPASRPSGGSVAMLGGTSDHVGVHPGPGPSGRPVTKWRQHTGGEIYSSPVVVDGVVYVGTKSGFLAAYDAATGEEKWRFDLGGYIVRATPAVVDGVAYIGAGYGLFAIDVATGTERWRMPIRFAGAASPNVANDTVVVATQEGHLYAVEAGTGAERWHYEADGLIFGAPAIFDDTVYFASDAGGIHAMAAETGRLAWRANVAAPIRGAPVVGPAGAVFNSEEPAVFAFDEETGDELWRAAIGGESAPALTGQLVLVGSAENGLYALDAATGERRWLFPTGSPVLTAPAIAGETVFVSSGSTLYAIDLETGEAAWSYPAGDRILTSPAVVDGVVYFGSRDGFLYAITGDGAVDVDGP